MGSRFMGSRMQGPLFQCTCIQLGPAPSWLTDGKEELRNWHPQHRTGAFFCCWVFFSSLYTCLFTNLLSGKFGFPCIPKLFGLHSVTFCHMYPNTYLRFSPPFWDFIYQLISRWSPVRYQHVKSFEYIFDCSSPDSCSERVEKLFCKLKSLETPWRRLLLLKEKHD